MVKYCTIGITFVFIIDLVTPLVWLGLGLGINTYHNVQLFQWVKGKAKCTSPLISWLDTCGGDRKRFLKVTTTPTTGRRHRKVLVPTIYCLNFCPEEENMTSPSEKRTKRMGAAAGSKAVPEGGPVNNGDTNQGLQIEESSSAAKLLLENALSWTSAYGLSSDVNDPSGLWTTTHIPFSLMPNSIPGSCYRDVIDVVPAFHKLVDRISRDSEWLNDVLKNVVTGDPFTAELLKIYNEMQRKPQQPFALGLFRNDYMLHETPNGDDTPQMLQVEMNTIASAYGCSSGLTFRLHRHLITRFSEDKRIGPELRRHLEMNGLSDAFSLSPSDLVDRIPINPSLIKLPAALAAAHEASELSDKGAIVIFVVKKKDGNYVDQGLLEFELWENHRIPALRMTLEDIATTCKLKDGDGSPLLLEDGTPVSVVYFRSGYSPDQYPTSIEWSGRRIIEYSSAIKCPNIGYHLAGTKKVQQILAMPGQVERFLPDERESIAVRRTFAGLWGLEPNTFADVTLRAKANPDGYVLKPQREGGGNNMYGHDITKKLDTAPPEELETYILMQLIKPKTQKSILVNRGCARVGPSISEYGVYSTYLGKGDNIPPVVNDFAGMLVRTKEEGVNEGGVSAGYSSLSSLILTD
eukprot:447709_1